MSETEHEIQRMIATYERIDEKASMVGITATQYMFLLLLEKTEQIIQLLAGE